MRNQNLKSSEYTSGQLDAAVEALAALRWSIDHTLENSDMLGFCAIARVLLPAVRAALESATRPDEHVRNALDAIGYIERETDRAMPAPSFDRLVAIADTSIERAQAAIEAAQDMLRQKACGISRSTRKSFCGRTVEESS